MLVPSSNLRQINDILHQYPWLLGCLVFFLKGYWKKTGTCTVVDLEYCYIHHSNMIYSTILVESLKGLYENHLGKPYVGLSGRISRKSYPRRDFFVSRNPIAIFHHGI